MFILLAYKYLRNMKDYQEQKSKINLDDSHEPVSATSADELRESIENDVYSQFGLGKVSPKRAAIFSALLEDKETVSMINSLMSKLKMQQDALLRIQKILGKETPDCRKQIREIKKVVSGLK